MHFGLELILEFIHKVKWTVTTEFLFAVVVVIFCLTKKKLGEKAINLFVIEIQWLEVDFRTEKLAGKLGGRAAAVCYPIEMQECNCKVDC